MIAGVRHQNLNAILGSLYKECQRDKLKRLCRYIARLAALVPKPRVNLARFHGVFAPNSKHRIQLTPGVHPSYAPDLD